MRLSTALALASVALLPLAGCQTLSPVAPTHLAALDAAVAAPTRTSDNIARDRYRHPLETLSFFGVRPSDTVVEIWPGGGWYTEILAPYLAGGGGRLIVATPNGQLGGVAKLRDANPALYGGVSSAVFPAFKATDSRVTAGSVDVVLTFRNVHNWRMGYQRADKQDYSAEAFRQMFAMLKPGGTLGVVDHRLPEAASAQRERESGYIKVSTVRALAEAAGFRLVAASEVNANPLDTTDWEDGVWTLPPTLALKDKDRNRYLAIGESDRMTLKFVKPR
ncbi:class I SAM-dependent methyltransferase [Sphingomonas sinipercae]|uniref:Class I SAM-dependent methyltransferase n=1 Tax=Sphingomonas sinipercae TaxID=2714944 RepID=A0A6G7ZPH7_9SPHN|nr:class I SAM-dependent methyltransferase [Sphingomonas sinipercae]QIL02897.1 class I SAM-dependent methyltransferase [Sphingomonas sinipercae]